MHTINLFTFFARLKLFPKVVNFMKKFFQKLSVSLLICSGIIFGGIIYASAKLPNNYIVYANQSLEFEMFPYSIKSKNDAKTRVCCGSSENIFALNLNFLNIIPIKTVFVNSCAERYAVPCGAPFGAKIHTNGIIVIDAPVKPDRSFLKFDRSNDLSLRKGDVILKANGKMITSTDEFENIVNSSNGHEIQLTIARNERQFDISITPQKSEDGKNYCAGIWVRDSSAGIGTLTFYDPTNDMFAGLGHGICDVDTGNILSVMKGEITSASIISVQKGESGLLGELKGCFTSNIPLGEIYSNGGTGLYGKLSCRPKTDLQPMKIAPKQTIKTGEAQILTTISGTSPCFYNINIDSVNYNINSPTKNIKITVTDQELLEKTGGIVQGMSGSPIIQNGMIVGAVTHVLVNNPKKGYGIFAETMISNSDSVLKFHYKK